MPARNICPICKQRMTRDNNPSKNYFNDFLCKNKKDHFFAIRIQDGDVSKIKVKVLDEPYFLFMKVNIDENNTQVWKKETAHSLKDQNVRITVDHACKLDLSCPEKIKNKIKTYLLFS